ncbi:MarR family winged helix-turn-helix transcriptional regulator [Kocuria sp. LUK]|uniref:HTH marR-type domain-containing protein n=1 Tax=Kocuria flava TaxID=446860 RepID=A0A2N4T3X4_9MICC|nr:MULTISPECIES: MarR family winged helix-turn-helix transcriptional regulator [Kocuria]MCD1144013.1 MarR family winged helix-turn-helix transcriptional regulator [Kocuria sp. LUK]PLC12912.1 hypothetical protein AUQ48_12610 [Kocuria flava]
MPVSHETAVELVRDLLELQRVMRRVTKVEPGRRRLSPTSVGLLSYLTGTGPRRATVMAAETGLGPSGLSRQLAGLEEAGLVERTPDPEDGRAALVAITDHGRDEVRAAVELDAQRLAERLAGWDEDRARSSRGAINEITTVFLDSLGVERTTSCRGGHEPPGGAGPAGAPEDRPQHDEHEEQTAR